MRTTPYFVTPYDFFNFWGVNLDSMLKTDDNLSNKSNIFLMRVERKLMSWIDSHTYRIYDWEQLEEYQVDLFQKAILTQAMYMFRNGDIGLDSGYDPEKGILADKKVLDSIEVPQEVIDYLIPAGLFNLVVRNKPRFISSLY